MISAVVAAMAAVLAVAATGPALARRLPPRWAVRLVGIAVTAAAISSVFVLGVLAFLWLGQLGRVAEQGSWSAAALRSADPISHAVSIASGVLLLPFAAWTVHAVLRQLRHIREWRRIERDLPVHKGISVLATDDVDAFTLPSGRIIVTDGLLAALTPAERQIVLAHERSHRRHRHSLWRWAMDLAAVNPLLRPSARAIADLTERWADEDACRIADRRTVAHTIGKVALLRTHRASATTAAATGGQTLHRVRALLSPPPRTRPVHLLSVLILLAALATTTYAVEDSGEDLFEYAMHTAVHDVRGVPEKG